MLELIQRNLPGVPQSLHNSDQCDKILVHDCADQASAMTTFSFIFYTTRQFVLFFYLQDRKVAIAATLTAVLVNICFFIIVIVLIRTKTNIRYVFNIMWFNINVFKLEIST